MKKIMPPLYICLSFSEPGSNISFLSFQTSNGPHIPHSHPCLSFRTPSHLRVDPPSDGGGKARQRLLLSRAERRVGQGEVGVDGGVHEQFRVYFVISPSFFLVNVAVFLVRFLCEIQQGVGTDGLQYPISFFISF